MSEKPEKDPALVKRGKAARNKGAAGEREVCEISSCLPSHYS